MNTQRIIRNIQLLGGGIALASVAGLAYAIANGLRNHAKYHRDFDPETIEEIEGKILEIGQTDEKNEETRGFYLIVHSDGEVIHVHLGPAWYLRHQEHRLKTGKKIFLRGSRVQYRDREILVPITIRSGDEILRLRDENGMPNWYTWNKVA